MAPGFPPPAPGPSEPAVSATLSSPSGRPLQRTGSDLARRLQPTIAERARFGLLILTVAFLFPLVADWIGGGKNGPTLGAIEIVRVALFGALYVFLRPVRSRVTMGLAILAGGAVFAGSAAWIAVLRGDLGPYMIVTNGVALGTAVVLPWSPLWQFAVIFVFGGGLAAAFVASSGNAITLVSGNSVFAYMMGLCASVFLAALDQQRRRAIAESLDRTLQAGEALRDLNETLEQRVEERTEALAQANRELAGANLRLATTNRDLEAAYGELEGFTHSVSHDLRVPLRVIHGLSRLTLDEHGDALGEEARGYLARIGDAAIRLGEIGDDILTLARVARAPIVAADVDISRVAREITEELGLASPLRRTKVVVHNGLAARAEPSLLRIVLEHLLSNAWKFTRQRECAEIEVGPFDADGQHGFFVRDNGSGFAPEFAGKLFQAFERIHDDADLEGRGVGLAIAHRIISRHGGRIHAEGLRGVGATFRVTLPSGPA